MRLGDILKKKDHEMINKNERISGKIIYAETFNVGRGVVDISINSDASKEIINIGSEILRNL